MTCRRQARVIEALDEAMATMRHRLGELKTRNAELRAENDRIR